MSILCEDITSKSHELIFMVDSNDRDCVVEVRDEVQRMLNKDKLRDTMLLVFANEHDLPNAINATGITY